MFKAHSKQAGITLIELVVTIVVLGVALVTLSGILQGGASNNSDITIEVRATALAQSYLDEILGKRYDERSRPRGVPPCRTSAPAPRQCSPEASFGFNYAAPVDPSENSRARLDDVDDYHGMDEGDGQATPLQDAEGNTRTGYDNFRVRVAVRYLNLGASEEEFGIAVNNELDDQYDAKLVTVTVSFRGNPTGWDFSAYKSNF